MYKNKDIKYIMFKINYIKPHIHDEINNNFNYDKDYLNKKI